MAAKKAIDSLIRIELKVHSPVLVALENQSAELRTKLAALRGQLSNPEPGQAELAIGKIRLAEAEHAKLAVHIGRIREIIATTEKLLSENATEVADHALRKRLAELMSPAV